MTHFADRLAAAVRARGNPLCVGLDPRWESLPLEVRRRHSSPPAAYEEFCSRVLDIVAPLVAVVKPQMAFFEACGPEGLAVLQRLLRKARGLGLLTILDGKRNDIASTAAAYADAAFSRGQHPVWEADALTVNPYLGRDAVEPFLKSARRVGGGVFVLVRTSNPGAGLFQDLLVSSSDGPPRPLYRHVGEAVAAWARENLGACGQGGTAADVAAAFRPDGLGAVVSSSRGVLFPFAPEAADWERQVEATARTTATALGSPARGISPGQLA